MTKNRRTEITRENKQLFDPMLHIWTKKIAWSGTPIENIDRVGMNWITSLWLLYTSIMFRYSTGI